MKKTELLLEFEDALKSFNVTDVVDFSHSFLAVS